MTDLPKILVVDDEPDQVEYVMAVLEEAGYAALGALSGAEGLNKVRSEKPELIILDIVMPEKDGFSTFVDLRKDPELKSIPVVMLTGVGEELDIRFSAEAMLEYLGQGPEAYLEKPVEPEVLRETIHKVLGG